MNVPSQKEVDSIASFVEAVNELENEPFFSRDEPRRFTTHGDIHRFELGDRFHFRSALITFRRIWMNDDAESFFRVCKLLERHFEPPARAMLHAFRDDVKSAKNSQSQYPNVAINGNDLINLWLNTVFAHSGLSGKTPTRQDFDRQVELYGHGALEYAFRHLILMIGSSYRNVATLARPLLAHYGTLGVHPSFKLGSAFGTQRRERTKEGHLIIRQSSSEYFSEETYEQRFVRIMKRQKFSNLKSVLNDLGFTDTNSLHLTLKGKDFRGIASQSDFELEILEALPEEFGAGDGVRAYVGFFDISTRTKSAVLFTETVVKTDVAGLTIIDRLLNEFREELVNS